MIAPATVPENANLYALIRSRFPENPDHPFLMEPGGGTLTYGDLDTQSARLAGYLKSLGSQPGDRVVVQVDKSPDAVVLYVACLRAGLVYVPLNIAYTEAEVSYFLGDAEPRVLVCRPETIESLSEIACVQGVPHVLSLGVRGEGTLRNGAITCDPDPVVVDRSEDDLAAILYTSGTTGRSKGAMLSHGNLSSNALVLHVLWGFIHGDVLLHALPIYHVHGLFVALHCALLNGSSVWFLPRFDVTEMLALMPRSTVMMGVPTFYVRLLDQPAFQQDICRNMRLFVAGSAPLLSETFNAFVARTGHRILERYGMTEAGMITSNPYEQDGRLAGTVGFALPGTKARVCDKEGREVARGETGTLEISGPNVFKGYWRQPEKTAAGFREDGFFVTGDLSEMASDGRISIVGRARDLIISGGLNVYPREVEREIDDLEGVVESAVIGVAHRDFGEAVTAIVVCHQNAKLTEMDIVDALANRLAKFKRPKRVIFVDALPRNAMGKVQKSLLRDDYATIYSQLKN